MCTSNPRSVFLEQKVLISPVSGSVKHHQHKRTVWVFYSIEMSLVDCHKDNMFH